MDCYVLEKKSEVFADLNRNIMFKQILNYLMSQIERNSWSVEICNNLKNIALILFI